MRSVRERVWISMSNIFAFDDDHYSVAVDLMSYCTYSLETLEVIFFQEVAPVCYGKGYFGYVAFDEQQLIKDIRMSLTNLICRILLKLRLPKIKKACRADWNLLKKDLTDLGYAEKVNFSFPPM